MPMRALIEVLSTIEAGIGEDRQQRLHQEEGALEVDRDRAVEAGLVPLFERAKSPTPAFTNSASTGRTLPSAPAQRALAATPPASAGSRDCLPQFGSG